MRLLVVEDDADTQEALATMLELEGARVSCAGTVAEALTQVLRTLLPAPPAAILCDIDLPDGDGYEFLRRLRAVEAQHGPGRIPVLAVTGYARAEHRARALAAGFAAHVPKPVDLPALLAKLRPLRPRR